MPSEHQHAAPRNCTGAQVLFSEEGYVYLDVRPALELDEVGKVKGAVNVPMMHAKRVFSPEENKKVVQKEENTEWLEQVLNCTLSSQSRLPILTAGL